MGALNIYIGIISLFTRKPYFTKEFKDCEG